MGSSRTRAFGTPAANITPSYYQFPDAPADTVQNGEIPFGMQDTQFNDQGIVKAQYTHAIGDRAYARLMGYTFFSDWNMTAPYSALANYFYGFPSACCDQNYLLITHTSGGQFQFSDQINDKNLLQFTVNQTYANVLRDNNTTATTAAEGAAGPYGIVAGNSQGNFTCWSQSTTNTGQNGPGNGQPDSLLRSDPGYGYVISGCGRSSASGTERNCCGCAARVPVER